MSIQKRTQNLYLPVPVCNRWLITLIGSLLLAVAPSYAHDTGQLTTFKDGSDTRRDTTQRDFSLETPVSQSLGECWPANDCSSPDKPCYLELTQDDFSEVLIGGADAPLVGGAVFRVRLCTASDNSLDNAICEDYSANQELDYQVFNLTEDTMEGQTVVWGALNSDTDTIDTGPYTQVGTHNFFGVVCQIGDQPCRIAWQYCEVDQNPNKTI